eukprot:g18598.t1
MACSPFRWCMPSLTYAFRRRESLCTPKLCEKLEQYARTACEAFSSRAELYRSFGGTADAVSAPRLPYGAGFFDDDLHFFVCEDLDPEIAPASPRLPVVHTLTSVLCWAAADRLHRIAAHYFRDPSVWIFQEICQHAWNPKRGSFTTFWGGSRVGPSILRLAELGFVSPEESRAALEW